MRILCVTDFPMRPPGCRWIWDHVADERDDVDFVTPQPGKPRFQVPIMARYVDYLSLAARATLRASRGEYDLLVAWENKTGLPVAGLRSLFCLSGPPFVLLTFAPKPLVCRPAFLARTLLDSVNHITVPSASEAELCRSRLQYPAARISVGPLGTYDVAASRAQSLDSRPLGRLPYVYSGGHTDRDYRTLFAASAGLPASLHVNARPGALASLSVPPNAKISDLAPGDQYRAAVRQAAVVVVPLHRVDHAAGLSLVLDAMSASRPVVCSDLPVTREYVMDGVTGLLVEPGDVSAMRSAILHLLDNPDLITQMGLAARKRYEERHTFDIFAQQTYDLLHRLHDC